MSTQTDKIRQAIERAMARIGCPPGDNSDADLYRGLQSALSELDAQPSAPTVDEVMDVVKQWGERYYYEGYLSDLRARLTKLLTNP